MTNVTNTFEYGTNSAAITTSSGVGGTDTPFDIVNLGASATATYDNTISRGGLSAKLVTPVSAVNAFIGWQNALFGAGTAGQVWFRCYVNLPALPPSGVLRLVEARNSGPLCGVVGVTSTGKIAAIDSTGATQATSTTSVVAGQWFRLEGYVIGSATVGQVQFKIFKSSPDSVTPDETITTPAALNTAGVINQLIFGNPSSQASFTISLDDLGGSTTGYLGPTGIAIKNQWNIGDTTGYGPCNTTIANTTGNALVAVISTATNTTLQYTPRLSIGDDAHNWWTLAKTSFINSTTGRNRRLDIWICPNAQAATTVSVSANMVYAGISGQIFELTGFPQYAQVEISTAASANSGTTASMTLNLTQADFVIGAVMVSRSSFGGTVTATGFNQLATAYSSTGGVGDNSTQWVQAGLISAATAAVGGSVTGSFTWTTSLAWISVMVAFKASPVAPTVVNPNWPVMKVEAAFGWKPGNLTGAVPTWTDITARCIDDEGTPILQAQRGRDYELTQPEAGTLTLALKNQDGAFNPTNIPYLIAWPGTNQLESNGNKVAASAGTNYSGGFYIWANQPWPAGVQLGLAFYNGGAWISTTNVVVQGITTTPQAVWVTNATAPATTTLVDVAISVQSSGSLPAGMQFYLQACPSQGGSNVVTGTSSGTGWVPSGWTVTGGVAPVQGSPGQPPYFPNVVPEVPIRLSCFWQGRQYGLGYYYAQKWPQDYPDPQYGMTHLQAADAIGIASQGSMPSAYAGQVLADFPYSYYPLGEFYSNIHGALFNNLSRVNGRPMVGYSPPQLPAGNGMITAGQSMNLAGDSATGIGNTQTPPATKLADIGGTFVRDSGLPSLAAGVTIEGWLAPPTATTLGQPTPIFGAFGAPQNYLQSLTVPNGARLVITYQGSTLNSALCTLVFTLYQPNGTVIATLSANTGGSPPLSTTGLIDFACQVSQSGSTWTLGVTLNGLYNSTTGTYSGTLDWNAMTAGGCYPLNDSLAYVSNYALGQIAVYPWILPTVRLSAHFNTGSMADGGDVLALRVGKLMAWSGLGLPFGVGAYGNEPSPLIGNADQIAGSALADALYNTSVDEGGFYYCPATSQGEIWYQPRQSLYNQQPVATFGDNNSSEIPYNSASGFDFSDAYLYNIVSSQRTISAGTQTTVTNGSATVQPVNTTGADAVVSDAPSEAQYFPRGPLQLDVETTQDSDAYDRANWALNKYKQPQLRANQIIVDLASMTNATWVGQVLNVEQGDIVLVNRRQAGAPAISVLCIVQMIQHNIGPDLWQVTFTLCPYFPESNVLQLDNASYNQAGSGALGW